MVDTPGPGSYDIPGVPIDRGLSTVSKGRVSRMKGREKFGEQNAFRDTASIPGPGSYPNARNPMHASAPVPLLLGKLPDRSLSGQNNPAPGAYKAPDSIGKQADSTKRSAPAASFGLGSRPPARWHDKDNLTGPGEYPINGSMGQQPLSTKRSAPAAKIKGRVPLVVKPASQRTGPGCYKVKQAMGKQFDSKKRSAPSATMAGRTRFGSPYYM